MPNHVNSHSDYCFTARIPGLQEPELTLLVQADCHVDGESVCFRLNRRSVEDDEQFMWRAKQWITRELSRVNVLTGKLHRAFDLSANPPLGVSIRVPGAWLHQVHIPSMHYGWSNESAEFRIRAWDVARHTEDPVLRFVMLNIICEAAEVNRDWNNKDEMPPAFAEIRIIRNLLVHGSRSPGEEASSYLRLCSPSIPGCRFSGREDYLRLAITRSAHLLSPVWGIVINDVLGIGHDRR
jgi:hypothetical protein